MADKFMYSPMIIHKITPSVDHNKWFKRKDTQVHESTNQNFKKSPKLLSQQMRKYYYKTLGTSV